MSKKALLAVAVSLMVTAPSFAAAFADVPFDHWAYQAVEELAQAGVLEGYPDGLYRGPQPMTRYEFAVALSRAYDWIERTIKPEGGVSMEDVQKLLNSPEIQAKFRGPAGPAGAAGKDGSAGAMGPKGADGAPGKNGMDGKGGRDGKDVDPAEVAKLMAAMDKLRKEFGDELKALGADVTKMGVRLTALETKLAALSDVVDDHEARISELERWRWFASVETQMGLDGTADPAGLPDGDLGFEAGEAFSYLSVRAGIDANLGGDMRGRFSWWYDSDGNPFHGKFGSRQAGLNGLGIDEAWVRLPGLGGRWIFGRQYAGQNYETGEADPALGLGTGYYTGAALTGIRAEYGLGSFGNLTLLAQADDNVISGPGVLNGALNANIAGVARWDVDLPWFKDADGSPNVKLGFQSVAHFPSNAGNVGQFGTKAFNDGTSSREFAVSANAWVDVLKGLSIEYTNQFKNVTGINGPDLDGDLTAEGQAVYAELGILDTPTFTLGIQGGLVEDDYNLSTSIITNPYVPAAVGVFALADRPVILDSFGNAGGVGPTQGFAVDFGWNIGNRTLAIRGAGSTRRLDLFNWMVSASFPIVQTGNGNVTIDGIYADVDGGHVLNPFGAFGTSNGTVGVRVKGGLSF